MTRENQSIVTFDISEKQNYRNYKDGRGFREWKVERTFSLRRSRPICGSSSVGDPQLARLMTYHSATQERAWKNNRYKFQSPLYLMSLLPMTEQEPTHTHTTPSPGLY